MHFSDIVAGALAQKATSATKVKEHELPGSLPGKMTTSTRYTLSFGRDITLEIPILIEETGNDNYTRWEGSATRLSAERVFAHKCINQEEKCWPRIL